MVKNYYQSRCATLFFDVLINKIRGNIWNYYLKSVNQKIHILELCATYIMKAMLCQQT
jgi:hypothetical protein